jgi:hypothetical protein
VSLDELVRQIVEDVVARRLREVTQDLPGNAPEWTTIARFAKAKGFGYSTVRRKAKGLQRGPAGRLRTADLERAIAGRPPDTNPVTDIASARARRAAGEILGRKP